MEFSEIFSFLIILNEPIQILPRNGKLTASTAILSIVLPSIIFQSFIHFHQYLTDKLIVNASHTKPYLGFDISRFILKYLAPLLLVEIAHMLVYFMISHVSGITTILVSSASYTGNSLSSKDVLTSIKRTWRKPLFHFPRQSLTNSLPLILLQVPVFIGIMHPNIFTISTAVITGTVLIVFQVYSSVAWALSIVVMILEESCSPERATEKAGDLVKGHHLKGFMLNLFVNLLGLIVLGLVWVFSCKGSLDLTLVGLFFINAVSVVKMVLFTAYTVLYFQCKKHHGEEIIGYGDIQYTKLSSSMVGDHEIPRGYKIMSFIKLCYSILKRRS